MRTLGFKPPDLADVDAQLVGLAPRAVAALSAFALPGLFFAGRQDQVYVAALLEEVEAQSDRLPQSRELVAPVRAIEFVLPGEFLDDALPVTLILWLVLCYLFTRVRLLRGRRFPCAEDGLGSY